MAALMAAVGDDSDDDDDGGGGIAAARQAAAALTRARYEAEEAEREELGGTFDELWRENGSPLRGPHGFVGPPQHNSSRRPRSGHWHRR